MQPYNVIRTGLFLGLFCLLAGCNRYDTTKFDFLAESNRFAPHIKLIEDEDLRITVGNIYASYPDGRYEFGINTEVRVSNLGSQPIVLDSIICRQFYRSIEVSDSVHVEGEPLNTDSLPVTLCPKSDGISCSVGELEFYVDNQQHRFKLGDTIRVETSLWYTLNEHQYHQSKVLRKVYRRERGFVMP